jgi:RNA recognition motif-containing protein
MVGNISARIKFCGKIMSSRLFVGNLSFNLAEEKLQQAFAAHGTVESVDLIKDKFTGNPRGFAFVTMSNAQEAEAAIKALHDTDMDGANDGRKLVVNEARPREDRPPGERSGGGYRGGGGGGGERRGGGGGGWNRDSRGGGERRGGGGGGWNRDSRGGGRDRRSSQGGGDSGW